MHSWIQSKKVTIFTVAVVTVTFGLVPARAFAAEHAGSATCAPGSPVMFGRHVCDGFFSGTDVWNSGISVHDIIENDPGSQSLLGVQNVDQFISTISTALNGTGDDSTGAAFLMATMLNYQGTDFTSQADGITKMKAQFATWEATVRAYDSQGKVDWNPTNTNSTIVAPFVDTAMSLNVTHDPVFYMKQTNEVNPMITFTNPDGSTYLLNKNCANSTGELMAALTVVSTNSGPTSGTTTTTSNTVNAPDTGIGGFQNNVLRTILIFGFAASLFAGVGLYLRKRLYGRV